MMARRLLALFAVALLALGLVLLLFPPLALALSLFAVWYVAMSAADWMLHRLVLHSDNSPIMAWRHAHWVHHREFDGAIQYKTGASLTFTSTVPLNGSRFPTLPTRSS